MSKTIWVDLTDISVWTGHHTGIQRAVYQVAKRYAERPDAKFFIFDKKTRTFKQTVFNLDKDQLTKQEESHHAEVYKPAPDRLKSLAYKAYSKSPMWMKDRLASPRNKARIRKLYHGVNTRIKNKGKHSQISFPLGDTIKFAENDTLLIMGKVWDYYPDYIECLSRMRMDSPFKIVQMVHDMIPVYLPHLFDTPLIEPYTKHMFESVSISDGILAVSKSTANDTKRFCRDMKLNLPQIVVIRHGEDFSNVKPLAPNVPNLQNQPFILAVGTLEVRKNHQLLYNTYREAFNRGIKLPDLVIAGSPGWYEGDILYQFAHDPAIKDRVHILQGPNDQELRWLYGNCLFTIYPSVYEGWGLPIAESLYYGKLCISSNAASLPEIAGDLIDYFSPYNSEECLQSIVKYLDQGKRLDKEKEIAKKYKPGSWDTTFEQIDNFIASLAQT